MPPFMLEIELAQPPPLEALARDYLARRHISIEFCRRVTGVPDSDAVVARRLGVMINDVRGWRLIGKRVSR